MQTVPSPEGQRLPPTMPVGAYKTYQIVSPVATHWRKATCAEVDCDHYVNGFRTRVDERLELGQKQAHYIRKESGRRFTEDRDDAGLTVFTFEPGQRCFASDSHKLPLERPELYLTRPGDWRGNPTGERPYQHTKPEFWVEDFSINQDNLKSRMDRG